MAQIFEDRICKQCGNTFTFKVIPSEPHRGQYCSLGCAHESRKKFLRNEVICSTCGKPFTPDRRQARSLSTGRQKKIYCSPKCYKDGLGERRRGEANPHWKGGKASSYGYRYRREPGKLNVSPYVAEHRLVAETMLGRPLADCEVVHHINKNRSDNRPENLLVMTVSEHMKFHMSQRQKGRDTECHSTQTNT